MATYQCKPTVAEFSKVLKEEKRWYQLGVFLGATTQELDDIHDLKSQSICDILMLYIQLYGCLEKKEKSLSWERIAEALRVIENYSLAVKIYTQYIKPSIIQEHSTTTNQVTQSPLPTVTTSTNNNTPAQHDSSSMTDVAVITSVPVIHNTDPSTPQAHVEAEPIVVSLSSNDKQEPVSLIVCEYETLSTKFENIMMKIKQTVKRRNVDLDDMQHVVIRQCDSSPQSHEIATVNAAFAKVVKSCSILNFNAITFLVENLLSDEETLLEQLMALKRSVERFKSSANMVKLVTLIKSKQTTPTGGQKRVELKVREFWSDLTLSQFEIIVNKIFHTLYNIMTHITVGTGCICLNWIIPDIDTTELVPVLPLELIRLIGVIYLHIGNKTIYDIEGDGCESIEAAMIQAIELKNTRAIELLLAVGCSPQVATYTDSNTVTNIVNIKAIESGESSSGSSGSVDHVCILGHNKHVEAIIDPSSEFEPECSSCSVNKKMDKQLHQEVESLRNEITVHVVKNEKLASENELLEATFDMLNAEISLLKKTNERLIEEAMLKDKSNRNDTVLDSKDFNESSSTAVLPHRRRRLGINAEMKVKVITSRNNNGKELVTVGSRSVVRAILTCNEEECPVSDNNDGTYTITVIPQQLGQHELSITVNSEYIEGSPFTLDIVPQRDYTQINKPVQQITGIVRPTGMIFLDNGDMFVTSGDDHIHVYDMKGYKKTTIDSGRGGGARGIDVYGEVVYVVDRGNHRIQQLTTEGEFIGTFGEYGSAIGQFNYPYDVKISPVDGKVYVADTNNHRIQVFNPDWSISHVIDGSTVSGDSGFGLPWCIAFDQSGNIHVGHLRYSVTVFTSSGQFVRCYGDKLNVKYSWGICIDPSGYSLVTSYKNGTLSIFDSKGTLIHSVSGLNYPRGISISPVDGSVWVADTVNNRVLKY